MKMRAKRRLRRSRAWGFDLESDPFPFGPSTGRVNVSEPEVQNFPGTPQAEEVKRRMRAALAKGSYPYVATDFGDAELRLHRFCVQDTRPVLMQMNFDGGLLTDYKVIPVLKDKT